MCVCACTCVCVCVCACMRVCVRMCACMSELPKAGVSYKVQAIIRSLSIHVYGTECWVINTIQKANSPTPTKPK